MLFMDTEYLHDVAVFNVAKTWSKARKLYPTLQIDPPRVIVSNRLKICAGKANSDEHWIKLSSELFWQYTEEFVRQIIPHEVAHIVSDSIFGWKPHEAHHGKSWSRVMQEFGLEPEPYHYMVNHINEKRKAARV